MGITQKHKKAFEEIVENGRNKGEAMIKAGYSPNTAKAPTKMTKTKGWQELLEKHLPDSALIKVHKEGLSASKKIVINGKDLGVEEPDYGVRHKYLDTAYKVKGKLIENLNAIQINIGRKSTSKLQDEELNRLMDVFNDKTKVDNS
mgnify:CR=1 FL=1